MKMGRHENIGAEPRAAIHALFGEADERFLNGPFGQNRTTIIRAGRYKTNRSSKGPIETSQALLRASAVIDRRYRERNRASSFSWIPSNPPLLNTVTISFFFSIGVMRSMIASAFCS